MGITVNEFYNLQKEDETISELINGIIYRIAGASTLHQRVNGNLHLLLVLCKV